MNPPTTPTSGTGQGLPTGDLIFTGGFLFAGMPRAGKSFTPCLLAPAELDPAVPAEDATPLGVHHDSGRHDTRR